MNSSPEIIIFRTTITTVIIVCPPPPKKITINYNKLKAMTMLQPTVYCYFTYKKICPDRPEEIRSNPEPKQNPNKEKGDEKEKARCVSAGVQNPLCEYSVSERNDLRADNALTGIKRTVLTECAIVGRNREDRKILHGLSQCNIERKQRVPLFYVFYENESIERGWPIFFKSDHDLSLRFSLSLLNISSVPLVSIPYLVEENTLSVPWTITTTKFTK